ncbi:MAG: hypothetical protein M3Q44_07815 [bacterium]|nr:hypothetical protein [bacterium]
MQYLQNEQSYIDRYDLHTIGERLDTVKMFREVYRKSLISDELKDLTRRGKIKKSKSNT